MTQKQKGFSLIHVLLVRFDAPDEAGFASEEARTAEKIMKTFDSF